MLNLSIEPNVSLSLFVWNWKTLYFLIWLFHKSLGVAEVTAAKTIFFLGLHKSLPIIYFIMSVFLYQISPAHTKSQTSLKTLSTW